MKGKPFALRKVFGTLLVSVVFALTCAALPLQAYAQERDAKAQPNSHNAVVLLLDDSAGMTPQSRESLKEAAKRIGKGVLESDAKARVAIVFCGRSNAALPFTGKFDSVKSFVDTRVSGGGNAGVDAGAGLQNADATARRLESGPSDTYVRSIVTISNGMSVTGDFAQRQARSMAPTYRMYSLGLSGSTASAVESLKHIQNAGYFEEKDLDVLERHVVERVAKSLTSVETSVNHQDGQPILDKLTGDRSGVIAVLGPIGTGGNAPENGSGAGDQGKGSGGGVGDNASEAPSAPDKSGAGNDAPRGTLSQTNSSGNSVADSNDADGESVRNRFVNSNASDQGDDADRNPDPAPISDSKKATGGHSEESLLPQMSDPSSTLAALPFSLGILSIVSGLFLRRRGGYEDAVNG